MTVFDKFSFMKAQKGKENFVDNQYYNSSRLFNFLPSFPLTTTETMDDYYLGS